MFDKANGIPLIGDGRPDAAEQRRFYDALMAAQAAGGGFGVEPATKACDRFKAALIEMTGGSPRLPIDKALAAACVVAGNVLAEFLWQYEQNTGALTMSQRRGRLAAVLSVIGNMADMRLKNEIAAKREAEAAPVTDIRN